MREGRKMPNNRVERKSQRFSQAERKKEFPFNAISDSIIDIMKAMITATIIIAIIHHSLHHLHLHQPRHPLSHHNHPGYLSRFRTPSPCPSTPAATSTQLSGNHAFPSRADPTHIASRSTVQRHPHRIGPTIPLLSIFLSLSLEMKLLG